MSLWSDLMRLKARHARTRVSTSDGNAHAPATALEVASDRTSVRVPQPLAPSAMEPPPAAPADANGDVERWEARVLDHLSDGVLLLDASGELTYRNSAAVALLACERPHLLDEARALAQAALAAGTNRRALGTDVQAPIGGTSSAYRLSALVAPAAFRHVGSAGGEPVPPAPRVLVIIARTASALPSPAWLRQRFQLTAREASVALLLAEGRSNGSIARRLGISASTTRHYTETVLLKLAIPTRAAVAAVLLGIYEHTDEHPLPRPDARAPSSR